MEIFGIGVPEIALIMVVALIVFGPERLPEIAREAGKMVRQFRQMTSEATSEIRSLTGDLDKELKSVTSMVSEEVRTVRNEVTGTLMEQYKVTTETVAEAVKTEPEVAKTEPEVTVTAREVTDAERDEFNRRRMEELAFASPAETQNLIDSAVESSPATSITTNGTTATLAENSAGEWPPKTSWQLAPDTYSAETEGEVIVPQATDLEPVAPSANRPKPRIARRSAYGAIRHREQE